MFEYELNWIVKPDVCWLDPTVLESNPLILNIRNRRTQWKIQLVNNNNVIQFVLVSSADVGLPDSPFSSTHIKCTNKNRTIAEVVDGSYKTVINDNDRNLYYYFYPTIRTTLFNLTFQYWQSFKVIVSFNLNTVLQLQQPAIQITSAQADVVPPQPAQPAQPAQPTNNTKLYVFAAENPHADQILQDYGRLLNEHSHSDIKLIVKDHHFRCHKAILAARCKNFADIIKKNSSDTMTLPTIDVDTAADLLYYIYAGRAPNIKKTATRLMLAADEFELTLLKFRCVETIKHEVNVVKKFNLLQITHGTDMMEKQDTKYL